jgi:hypothetical protein
MSETSLLALIFVVAVVAGALGGNYATHRERFRRLRRDIKTQWRGLRTLGKMLRRTIGALIQAAVLIIVAVLVIAAIVRRAS